MSGSYPAVTVSNPVINQLLRKICISECGEFRYKLQEHDSNRERTHDSSCFQRPWMQWVLLGIFAWSFHIPGPLEIYIRPYLSCQCWSKTFRHTKFNRIEQRIIAQLKPMKPAEIQRALLCNSSEWKWSTGKLNWLPLGMDLTWTGSDEAVDWDWSSGARTGRYSVICPKHVLKLGFQFRAQVRLQFINIQTQVQRQLHAKFNFMPVMGLYTFLASVGMNKR